MCKFSDLYAIRAGLIRCSVQNNLNAFYVLKCNGKKDGKEKRKIWRLSFHPRLPGLEKQLPTGLGPLDKTAGPGEDFLPT